MRREKKPWAEDVPLLRRMDSTSCQLVAESLAHHSRFLYFLGCGFFLLLATSWLFDECWAVRQRPRYLYLRLRLAIVWLEVGDGRPHAIHRPNGHLISVYQSRFPQFDSTRQLWSTRRSIRNGFKTSSSISAIDDAPVLIVNCNLVKFREQCKFAGRRHAVALRY